MESTWTIQLSILSFDQPTEPMTVMRRRLQRCSVHMQGHLKSRAAARALKRKNRKHTHTVQWSAFEADTNSLMTRVGATFVHDDCVVRFIVTPSYHARELPQGDNMHVHTVGSPV